MKTWLALSLGLLSPIMATASNGTLVCDYLRYSDPDGSHKVQKQFSLTFVTDEERGTSHVFGNQGRTDVSFVKGIESYTFIEVTDAGNVMITTVTSKGQSVHSRNTVLGGETVPSQYYGKCRQK